MIYAYFDPKLSETSLVSGRHEKNYLANITLKLHLMLLKIIRFPTKNIFDIFKGREVLEIALKLNGVYNKEQKNTIPRIV